MDVSHLLPWDDKPPMKGQTILLTDTIKTDGRFMLHILASQYISIYNNVNIIKSKKSNPRHHNSGGGKLIWISCTSETEKQIMKSINMYYDKISTSSTTTTTMKKSSSFSCFEVISAPKEIFSCNNNNNSEDNYLHQLYLRIFPKKMQEDDDKEVTIIIDDLSYLINFFGDRQVFGFIQELRNRSNNNCNRSNSNNNKNYLSALILRNCSEILHPSNNNLSSKVYVGTDTFTKDKEVITDTITSSLSSPFDYLLYEIVDGIIDIIPLSSGYYKDATSHGRIIFTECYNNIMENNQYNGFSNYDKKNISDPFIISFCYTELGVRMNTLRRNA